MKKIFVVIVVSLLAVVSFAENRGKGLRITCDEGNE